MSSLNESLFFQINNIFVFCIISSPPPSLYPDKPRPLRSPLWTKESVSFFCRCCKVLWLCFFIFLLWFCVTRRRLCFTLPCSLVYLIRFVIKNTDTPSSRLICFSFKRNSACPVVISSIHFFTVFQEICIGGIRWRIFLFVQQKKQIYIFNAKVSSNSIWFSDQQTLSIFCPSLILLAPPPTPSTNLAPPPSFWPLPHCTTVHFDRPQLKFLFVPFVQWSTIAIPNPILALYHACLV